MRLSLFFMDLNRIFTFKLGLLEEVPGQLTSSLAEVAFAACTDQSLGFTQK